MNYPVQVIPIAAIDAEDRLRPIDPSWVDFLARSIEEQGLTQPVVVRPGKRRHWKLVAGAHRIAALQKLGIEEVEAVIRLDLESDDEARLIEIAENLMRQELTKLDRALFLREWQEAIQRINPDLKQGGDRKSAEFKWKKSSGKLPNFGDIAEIVGLSDTTIRRSCRVAERLTDEAILALRETDLVDNEVQLRKLAELPPSKQLAAIREAASGNVDRTPPSEADLLARLTRLYNSMPLRVQRRFRAQILGSHRSVDASVEAEG